MTQKCQSDWIQDGNALMHIACCLYDYTSFDMRMICDIGAVLGESVQISQCDSKAVLQKAHV